MKKIRYISLFLTLFAVVNLNAMELTLTQCREMALQTDEDLKIATNRISQADLDRGIAKTAYFPKIDANGAALYLAPNPSMGGSMDILMRGVYMAGISLTQPIYTGGKIITGNKLAGIGKEVSQYQYEATKMDVLADAEKSYWMYVAVLSKIDMIQSYITQLDSIYAYTQASYQYGLTTELNVNRVKSRQTELQYRLKQAKSGADLCRMALCRIIGVPENEEITPIEKLGTVSLPEFSFTGIDERPELKMIRKNIEVKKLNVKMALSDFLPTVGLQVGYNAFGNVKMKSFTTLPDGTVYPFTQKINYNGFMGAVSVSIPIFHWGEGYKKVKKSKIEVSNATLEFEKNSKLMELQARQMYNNYIDGYELIGVATKALEEARDNLEAISEQYQAGLMTLTDVLEAQAQWHTSYANLIEAKTQYKINEVDYRRSVGILR